MEVYEFDREEVLLDSQSHAQLPSNPLLNLSRIKNSGEVHLEHM